MRIGLFWRILPTYLFVCALFVLPIWQKHQAQAYALSSAKAAQAKLDRPKPTKPVVVAGNPVRIVVPRLGIDLEIIRGGYNIGAVEWSVGAVTANYAENTAYTNSQKDKTLIYGHWTERVFGNTKNLIPGDVAYIYTDNNHILKYIYTNKRMVTPNDVSIFNEFRGKPGLVLMTCEGSWAENRRLMYFDLKSAI